MFRFSIALLRVSGLIAFCFFHVSPAAAGVSDVCGCSWSQQHGCVIGSSQLLIAMANLEDRCGVQSNLDCALAQTLANYARHAEVCLGLGARECSQRHYMSKGCQWGAQETAKCGVSIWQLIANAVDVRMHCGRLSDGSRYAELQCSKDPPLLRAIGLQERCYSHRGGSFCNGDPVCAATYSHPSCDIKPTVLADMMLPNPSILAALRAGVNSTYCNMISNKCTTLEDQRDGSMSGECLPRAVSNDTMGASSKLDSNIIDLMTALSNSIAPYKQACAPHDSKSCSASIATCRLNFKLHDIPASHCSKDAILHLFGFHGVVLDFFRIMIQKEWRDLINHWIEKTLADADHISSWATRVFPDMLKDKDVSQTRVDVISHALSINELHRGEVGITVSFEHDNGTSNSTVASEAGIIPISLAVPVAAISVACLVLLLRVVLKRRRASVPDLLPMEMDEYIEGDYQIVD